MGFCKTIAAFILSYFTCLTAAHAQTFYANTPERISEISVSAFDCFVKDAPVNCVGDFFSVAIFGDTLYFLTVNSGLYRTLLSRPTACEKVMDLRPLNSLTTDKNGMLWGAMATNLVKINIRTQTSTEYQMSFAAAGDLIFYKNKLYLAASPNIIAQIDTANPLNSSVYFELEQQGIFGLTSIEGSCSGNRVFALATNGMQTKLIELDMENRKSLGVKCTIEGTYHDAASITENGTVPGLHIGLFEKRNICLGSTAPSFFKIAVSGTSAGITYQLNNTISNNTGIFENLKEGNYKVHIFSKDSCFADTSFTITKGYCDVKLPTAFTPNGDGLNDIFKPLGLIATGSTLLCIYNRWGKKIFESSNFSQGWNGKVDGFVQPTGTYIYTFKYAASNGKPQFLKGTVVLMQ